MATSTKGSYAKLKVFISYARRDLAFADRLVAALEARGIEVRIDRRDLPLLEEWQRELLGFIREADAVVFLVSRTSVASQWCDWEVAQVVALNKRLAPIIIEDVTESIPEAIRKINFVFFTPPFEFEAQADRLAAALKTDLAWIKDHTRIAERARRWAERGRSSALALRGAELAEAEHWLSNTPRDAPRPTPVHGEYIVASRAAAARQQRHILYAASAALAVTAGFLVAVYFQRNEARAQRNEALSTQSRFLADLARQEAIASDYGTALAISLEGVPANLSSPERPLVPEAVGQLARSLYGLHEIASIHVRDVVPQGVFPSLDLEIVDPDMTEAEQLRLFKASKFRLLPSRDGAGPWARDLLLASGKLGGRAQGLADPGSLRHGFVIASGTAMAEATDQRLFVLDLKSGNTLAETAGHGKFAKHASITPDGARFVTTAEGDPIAKLWDTRTGRLIADLTGQDKEVWAAEFSADGRLVVTAGGYDAAARVFDGVTGRPLHVLRRPASDAQVMAANFSPDSSRVLVSYRDGLAVLWPLKAEGLPVTIELKGHIGQVMRGNFSPDGTLAVTCSMDGFARVWRVSDGTPVAQLKHDDWLIDAQFSRDGSRLATASRDGKARVWDVRSGKVVATLVGHRLPALAIGFSDDGRQVLTSGADNTIRIWSVEPWQAGPIVGHHGKPVTSATFSGDSAKVLTAAEDGSAAVWDVASGRKLAMLGGHDFHISSAAISADGRSAVTGSLNGLVILHRLDGKRVILNDRGASAVAVAMLPDATKVAAALASGHVRVWNIPEGRQTHVFKAEGFVPTGVAIAFAENGGSVVLGSLPTITQWDLRTGELLKQPWSPEPLSVGSVFAIHGLRLAYVSGGTVRLRLAGDERVLIQNASHFTSVRFSPDGTIVAAASLDGTVHVKSIATDKPAAVFAPLDAAEDDLAAAEFSPDGRFIVTASQRGTNIQRAIVHDLALSRPQQPGSSVVASLGGHSGPVTLSVFSPDGRSVLTASEDGTVRIWRFLAPSDELIRSAIQARPRPLYKVQRQKAFLE